MIETHAMRVFAAGVAKPWITQMRQGHAASRAELSRELTEAAQEKFLTLDRSMHRSFVEALGNRAILVTHSRLQDNLYMVRRVHQPVFNTFSKVPVISISDSQRRPVPKANWVRRLRAAVRGKPRHLVEVPRQACPRTAPR